MPAWWALPAISAGVGLLGNLFDRRQSNINVKATNQANLELAKYSYGQEIEQMRELLKYNTPTNQMARFKEAGLNPNLIYGQATSGNQNVIPKFDAPKQDYSQRKAFDPVPAMSGFMDASIKQAQTDNLEANTINTLEKSKGQGTANQRAAIDLRIDEHLEGAKKEAGTLSVDKLKQQIKNMKKDHALKTVKHMIMVHREKWEKFGLTGSDALWARVAVKFLDGLGISVGWLTTLLKEGLTPSGMGVMQQR